jgi:hypothetical protein
MAAYDRCCNFKTISPKNLAKKLRFWSKYCWFKQKMYNNIGKLGKIAENVIIASTPILILVICTYITA